MFIAKSMIYYFNTGHDPNVPAFERISMPSNPASGDVSLQIRNLTIEDAGEYECQVTPSKNQPLLRRRTYLTVTGRLNYHINFLFVVIKSTLCEEDHSQLKHRFCILETQPSKR